MNRIIVRWVMIALSVVLLASVFSAVPTAVSAPTPPPAEPGGPWGSLDLDSPWGSGGGSSEEPTEPQGPEPDIDADAPSDWAPPTPLATRIEPREETVVVAPGALISVSGDPRTQLTVVLSPGQPTPAVGGYLAVDVDQDAPEGVLGRVLSVNMTDGGATSVQLEPATIEDAYQVFQVNTVVGLEDAVKYDPGTSGIPTARAGPSPGAQLKKKITVGMFECTVNASADFIVDFDFFNPKASVQFDPFQQYLKVVLEMGPTLSATLKAAGASNCKAKREFMPKAWLPVAGPLGLKLEAQVHAEAKIVARSRVTTKIGVEIKGGNVRRVVGGPQWTNEVTTTVVGSANAHAGLEAALSLGGRANAGLTAGPELKLTRESNCLQLYGTGRASAFVEADAFISRWRAQLPAAKLADVKLTRVCQTQEPTAPPTTPSPPTTPTEPDPPVIQPGQLTALQISPQLRCQVQSPADGRSVYYGTDSCGTHIRVGETTYGGVVGTQFTPVSGPIDSGAGTAADPRVVRTIVAAGASGITLEQVDTFVEGSGSYNTAISVRNNGVVAQDVILYRAADCYLNQSDYGVGQLFPSAVSCTSPNGRRISWTDLIGGADRKESYYGTIWSDIRGGSRFDNTVVESNHDNGAGLSWALNIAPGATTVVRSRFSLDEPQGVEVGPATARRVADPPKPMP